MHYNISVNKTIEVTSISNVRLLSACIPHARAMLCLSFNILSFVTPIVIHEIGQDPLMTYLLSNIITKLPLQPAIHSSDAPRHLKPVYAIGSRLTSDFAR